ncbi:MAG: cbb3-type cytochrome oxidase assembly protein CcoS [Phycisphaerales bacterium]
MTALWIVLPLALVLAAIGVWAFIWTVRSGQLDDLDTPSVRMLVDDEESPDRR